MGKKRLGVGFIGSGFITRFHLQSWKTVRDADVLGIWSPNSENAASAAALARDLDIGEAKPYASIADMVADVLDELRSFAMFGGTKVVVVRNADAFLTRFREQLEDYVAQPSDSATLVLRLNSLPANQRIYKAIDAVSA